MCMFCGQVNKKFDTAGLDEHYLYNCPMLKKCDDCNEVRTEKRFAEGSNDNRTKILQCGSASGVLIRRAVLEIAYAALQYNSSSPNMFSRSYGNSFVVSVNESVLTFLIAFPRSVHIYLYITAASCKEVFLN